MGGYMFSKNILSLRINMLRQSYTLLRLRTTYLNATRYLCASINTNENEIKSSSKVVKKDISKAMKAYIERARTHNEFMKQQNYEFQIGKRHLANMMGEDPETFTQKDINAAIQYLFPSGLYEKEARPFMRPPERVFPQRKAAEFDETGRPHHFLFYTGRPAFYKLLFDVVENMNQMYKFEEAMIRKNNVPDPNLAIETAGYKWIGKAALERRLVETLTDREYENFEGAMERLISLPYAYKCLDFINKYRRPLINRFRSLEIPDLKYDEEGRGYVTVYECLRKRARGDVTIKTPGSGIITVNGLDISYFHDIQSREQLLFPLIFTNMLNKVDIQANVEGGGPSGQSGAIRWGIATGLRSFIDADMIEKMRIAGLLQRDYRTRERKKPGQAGARKKFTWKKR